MILRSERDASLLQPVKDVSIRRPERDVPVQLLSLPKVFLCHTKEDEERVTKLYWRLRDEGIDPWYDREKLVVGDFWEEEIVYAIEHTDFFAICLSSKAIGKTGFIQREIREAVKHYQHKPQGTIFLLPIRLEPCEIPNIKLDVNTSLKSLHWIDLFGVSNDIQSFADGIKRQWKKLQEA